MSALTKATADVAHFRARVLQDALNEVTRPHWLRRAEAFEAARARRTDNIRRPRTLPPIPLAALAEADEHCAQIAAACRHRADLAPVEGEISDEVWAALEPALAGCGACVDRAEAAVVAQITSAADRELEAATAALRAALDAGDLDAIEQAAAVVDALDQAQDLWAGEAA